VPLARGVVLRGLCWWELQVFLVGDYQGEVAHGVGELFLEADSAGLYVHESVYIFVRRKSVSFFHEE